MAEYGYRGKASVGNEKIQEVIPTLLIGLGGTGKQILTRLRKRVYDKYGEPSFPFLRTVAFDSNVQESDGVPTGEEKADYADVLMQTGKGELYGVEIGGEGYDLARADFKKKARTLTSWLHPSFFELVDKTSVTQGSGAYRQAGRLAFHSHFGNIFKVIDSELRKIRAYTMDAGRHNADRPFDVDQTHLDVTIVTSIAGGTGAGMFLDMAYLVKDILSSPPSVKQIEKERLYNPTGVTHHVTIIAVMPTAFTMEDKSKQNRFRLNAYSAILEMENYNTSRPDDNAFLDDESDKPRHADQAIEFSCNWNGDGEVTITGRPWDSCYLIDDVNDKNRGSERKTSDVQQMIADYLFLDIGNNPFATEKRSLRSNHADLNQNLTYSDVYDLRTADSVADAEDQQKELLYENRYGCTFSSFGLAEIYIDPQRMRRSAGYRLAANMVRNRWLGNSEEHTGNQYNKWSQFDLFGTDGGSGIERLGYKPDDLIPAVLRETSSDSREENQDWLQSINRMFDRLSQSNPGNTPLEQLLSKLYSALTTIRDSVDGTLDADEKKSTVRTTMEDRVRMLRGLGGNPQDLRNRLDLRSRARVNELGIRSTLQLLEEYDKDLRASRKEAAAIAEQRLTSPETIIARLNDALQVRLPCRRIATGIEFQIACENGRQAAIQWCRTAAAKLLDGIYGDALKFVSTGEGSLGKRYTDWRDFLDAGDSNESSVCKELDRLFEQFRKQPEDDRRISLVPKWGGDIYDAEINTELKDRNPNVGADPNLLEKFYWKKAEQFILTALQEKEEWQAENRCDMIEAWWDRRQKDARAINGIAESARRASCQPLRSDFGLAKCSNGNVVAELHSRNDRELLLQRMVDASAPYLPSIPRLRRQKIRCVWKNMLGVTGGSAGDDLAQGIADDVKEQLVRNPEDLERDDLDSKRQRFEFEESKLVFHRELRGVPAHFYDKLGQLHLHYHARDMKEDRKTCHVSYRQTFGDLPDIKLIDDQEFAEIAENAIDVYRGLILGFVECGDDGIFLVKVPERTRDLEYHLGTRIGRIVKHACCNKHVRRYLQESWIKWKDQATAKHLAVFYNAIQQTIDLGPRVIDAGGEGGDMYPPPKNCLEKLLVDAGRELKVVQNGEAYFDLLRDRDRRDQGFDSWRESFRSLSDHIRETCLEPADRALPIWQVDGDRVMNVQFPLPEETGSQSSSQSGQADAD